MTTLADPPAPVIDFVNVERRRDGVVVAEELIVSYAPAFGPLAATLSVGSGWNGATWTAWSEYELGGVRKAGAVVAVRLVRDERKVMESPPGADRSPEYEVSVVGESGWCSCRGFMLANEERRPCKHIRACARLLAAGQLKPETSHESGREADGVAVGGRAAGPGEAGPDGQAD